MAGLSELSQSAILALPGDKPPINAKEPFLAAKDLAAPRASELADLN
jgi:hypothetical protein